MATVIILNHQPVPLVPLEELNYADGDPVYLGPLVADNGDVYDHPGWYVWEDSFQDFLNLESLGSGQTNENTGGWATINFEKSLGRRLQPGETLVIEMT